MVLQPSREFPGAGTSPWNILGGTPSAAPAGPGAKVGASADGAEAMPARVGGCDLLEEIGRGGMGVVYRARQRALDRIVAVKMMLGGAFASTQARARFRIEAEATAQLRHPHIVAIHEVGEHEGLPYLVMDYVAGRSLDELVRDQPLPARSAATYLLQIAEAVACAHARGVVHRDLKPANAILDSDDVVRLTDFGLARRLDQAEARLTVSGQMLGSPNFMAPEQASGRGDGIADGGVAVDIYGLGATLYGLLTGRPPFVGESLAATTRQVVEADPVAPRLLNPRVPRDLETICLKCLEKDPARRYATAREVAEELGRFLRDEPIRARRPGWLGRAARWCRRRPALAGLLGVALVLLAVLVGTSARLRLASGGRQREAYFASLSQAQGMIRQGNIDLARDLLLRTPEPERDWEWGYLVAECHQAALVLPAHTNQWTPADVFALQDRRPVRRVGFDATGRLFTLGQDGTLRVWDGVSGRLCWERPGAGDPIESFRIDQDGDRCVLLSGARLVECDLADGGERRAIPRPSGRIYDLAWGPEGEFRLALVPPGAGDALRGLAWPAGQATPRLLPWVGPQVRRARFAADGQRLTAGDFAAMVVLRWDDGQTTGRFAADPDGVAPFPLTLDPAARQGVALDGEGRLHLLFPDGSRRPSNVMAPDLVLDRGRGVFSPDGRWFCLPAGGATPEVLEVATGRSWDHPAFRVADVVFSPDGRRAVLLDKTLSAVLYDVERRRVIRILRGHEFLVDQAVFSLDGRRVATADAGGRVRVWSGLEGRDLVFTGGLTWAAGYSVDGRHFSVSPTGGGLYVGDADSGRPVVHFRQEGQFSLIARFSPAGRLLAAEDQNGGVNLWDTTEGALRATLDGGDRVQAALQWSGDGRWLAAGASDGTVRVWDVASRALRHCLPAHTNWVTAVEFSRDSRELTSVAFSEDRVRLWDVDSGRETASWLVHPGGVVAARYHPDGRHLATAGVDHSIRLWDLKTRRMTGEMRLRGMAFHVDFSPDGRRLAVWSDKSAFAGKDAPSLQIWDVVNGRQTLLLEGHVNGGTRVAFHPDGTRVLSASYDGSLRQWEAFPWRTIDYEAYGPGTLSERMERYAAAYWRRRLAAEDAADGAGRFGLDPAGERAVRPGPPDSGGLRTVVVPFDRSRLPARDPATPAEALDLTACYNDRLDGSALFSYENDEDNDLRQLPPGWHRFDGVGFDVRGVVQLRELAPVVGGSATLHQDFPERTALIPVPAAVEGPAWSTGLEAGSGSGQGMTRRVARVHGLGAVTMSLVPDAGTPVLGVAWHYEDGGRAENLVRYGDHVRNWWSERDGESRVSSGRVAWVGSSPATEKFGGNIRLYHFALENPRPEAGVTGVTLLGRQSRNRPFVVALTVER